MSLPRFSSLRMPQNLAALLVTMALGIIGSGVVSPAIIAVSAWGSSPPLPEAYFHGNRVELIDPVSLAEVFDHYYHVIAELAAQQVQPEPFFSVFPPQALQQRAPSELAGYIKLIHMALQSVQPHARTRLLMDIFPEDLGQFSRLLEQGVAPLLGAIRVHMPHPSALQDPVEEAWLATTAGLRDLVRQHGGNAEVWLTWPEQSGDGLEKWGSAASALQEHTFVGELQLGDGVRAFVFVRDGHPLLAIWAVDGQLTVEFTQISDQVEVFTAAGGRREPVLRSGRLILSVGPEPLFVRGLKPSFIARAFLESGVDRLAVMLSAATLGSDQAEKITKILTNTQLVATDVWYLRAEDSAPAASGARSPHGDAAWHPPGSLASLEAGRPPEPDPLAALQRWEHMMMDFFALVRDSQTTQASPPEAGAGWRWHWGSLDALPMLVELGSALGVPWGGDEAAGFIEGTEMLIDSAVAFLQGADRPGAEGLLEQAIRWLHRAKATDNLAAAAAWALIARETAALAVESSVTETPRARHAFLLAPVTEVELRRAAAMAHGGQAALPVDVPLLRVFAIGDGDNQNDTMQMPPSGWYLEVESQGAWLWQIGPQVDSDAGMVGELRSVFAQKLGLTPLHLRLMVPSDTPAGRYPVHVRMVDPQGGIDVLTLYVTVR